MSISVRGLALSRVFAMRNSVTAASVWTIGMKEETYRRVTYDLTVSVAKP